MDESSSKYAPNEFRRDSHARKISNHTNVYCLDEILKQFFSLANQISKLVSD